jgi:hypothetical protein
MNRAEDLRADYERLGVLLLTAEGAAAAAIARERRLIGEQLEQLEPSSEVALVDELAVKRAGAGVGRPPARRGQSR